MVGVIVNTITVFIGSIIGVLFNNNISKKITDAIMTAIGLCVIVIGISGFITDTNVLVMIVSMVLGTAVGTAVDIDGKLMKLGDFVQSKVNKKNSNKLSITEGFVTATLLFCVGSMAIVGSINAGLQQDNTMLFTKSLLDMVSAIMLSASLGIGVVFSAGSIFIYQGALVLLAHIISPLLTQEIITQLNCVGSLLIFAIGLNLSKISSIKVSNMLPSIIFVPFLLYIYNIVF